MSGQEYRQWEYRFAVSQHQTGLLDSVDGAQGPVCFAAGSSAPMSIVQALDAWGAEGWELAGMSAVTPDQTQYVLKRARRQDGWTGARIHRKSGEG